MIGYWKWKLKVLLFVVNMIVYLENLRVLIDKL